MKKSLGVGCIIYYLCPWGLGTYYILQMHTGTTFHNTSVYKRG
jgi:hypothetical protein